MIIEFHDNDTGNAQGTLCCRVGHKSTVEYAYQAEMWVQDMFHDPSSLVRAYIVDYDSVYAVLKRDPNGKICYVARDPEYNGEWQLPYAYPGATAVAATMLGEEVKSMDDATRWASEQLRGEVACAVLLDEHGVVAAWERGPEGPTLVAINPRSQKGGE